VLFILYIFYTVFMRYSSLLEGRMFRIEEPVSDQQCWAKSRSADGPTPIFPVVTTDKCQAELVHPGALESAESQPDVKQLKQLLSQLNVPGDHSGDEDCTYMRTVSKHSACSRKGSKISGASSFANMQAWREKEWARSTGLVKILDIQMGHPSCIGEGDGGNDSASTACASRQACSQLPHSEGDRYRDGRGAASEDGKVKPPPACGEPAISAWEGTLQPAEPEEVKRGRSKRSRPSRRWRRLIA